MLYHSKKLKVFQKSERSFFDQVATYARNMLTFEKYPLMAELKLKMSHGLVEPFYMFSISAMPPEGTFQRSIHFYHYTYDHSFKRGTLRFLNDGLVVK